MLTIVVAVILTGVLEDRFVWHLLRLNVHSRLSVRHRHSVHRRVSANHRVSVNPKGNVYTLSPLSVNN